MASLRCSARAPEVELMQLLSACSIIPRSSSSLMRAFLVVVGPAELLFLFLPHAGLQGLDLALELHNSLFELHSVFGDLCSSRSDQFYYIDLQLLEFVNQPLHQSAHPQWVWTNVCMRSERRNRR